MSRRLAAMIGLLVGFAPAMAHAQTNIDEGKSPAQIFAGTCATCHKSTRGLAGGRGSLALKAFLAEHYTSSNDQAAAIAAYVLGAGGGENVPAAEAHGPPKPGPEHARLPTEEANPPAGATRQTGKREGEAPATATLQQPANEDARPVGQPNIMQERGTAVFDRRPAVGRHEVQPALVTRDHQTQPETVPLAPPPAAPPPSHETSAQQGTAEPSPAAAAATAPANADSGNNGPVPRDNIPD